MPLVLRCRSRLAGHYILPQPQAPEARMDLAADHELIVDRDAERLGGLNRPAVHPARSRPAALEGLRPLIRKRKNVLPSSNRQFGIEYDALDAVIGIDV